MQHQHSHQKPQSPPTPQPINIWTEAAHLFTWALLIGTQFWVTLVSGPTMFRGLSLETFKEVQGVLQPKYFLAQSLLYSSLLVMFLIRYRPVIPENSGVRYGAALLLATVLALTHQFVLAPAVTHAMEAKLPSFRKLHGCSMAVNTAQMCITLAYMRMLLMHYTRPEWGAAAAFVAGTVGKKKD